MENFIANFKDQLEDTSISINAETKFKEINTGSVNFAALNIYNTFEIDALYNDASFNSHQQRATNLELGKMFSMQTDSDKIALFKITYFSVENGAATIAFDMYITKLPTD